MTRQKRRKSKLYWKTSLCCPNDGDGGKALMMLWVLPPDEENEERQEGTDGEVEEIYFCKEEELEVLSSA